MLRLVSVHDDSSLGLELPGALVDVEHDNVHSEVHSRLLGGEAGTEAGIEEDHQEGLVASELLVGERILLYIFCLGKGLLEVAKLGY